ncbi:MAG TPA: carboxypeptidase regulatory-like domain-containing protein, partial [Bryobacteraceae bacterium]|nr:carboxypeptidase regulatory-like domain-containing protein [Bryobacteraceae bacterium]
MTKQTRSAIGAAFLVVIACSLPLHSQMTVTGTVSGTVQDPSGQVVAGAAITIVSDKTNQTTATKTNGAGAFSFIAVQPESYTLKVENAGFKGYERKNLVVTANERLALGDIQLQIGAVTDTISVEAQMAQVQTDSTEHSAVLTLKQLETLTARGRDVVSMLRTIPGVQYQSDPDSVGGQYGTGTPSIGGTNSGTNILAVDGVVSNDQGTPNVFSSVTTMDAIGEVKVILNSYQAEYAGNGGAIMEVVTKSGGRDYHGSAYYYLRNEALNANDFFNNRTVNSLGQGVPRPRYRYNTGGFTLGGPIYVPGKWNRDRTRLFGFYNLEQIVNSVPGAVNSYTMPSALERSGDFSQTQDLSGAVIRVNDPNNGQQFAGNVIPQSRLNQSGLALMKILPLPNFDNRAISGGNYNYQIQEIQKVPKRSQLFKFDYVPTDQDRIAVRGKTWTAKQQGYAVAGGSTPVGFFGQCYCFTESGLAVVGSHIFSPNVVMEYNAGVRHNHEAWYPYGGNNSADSELKKITR